MRVLIFGASGSIGTHLVESLKKDNIDVVGTTSNKKKVKINYF